MTNPNFETYAAYYDLLYSDKNYETEADYIAQAIRRSVPEAVKLLEFGSGTGRHGRLLAEQGFDVLGVEGSRSMLSQSYSHGFGPTTSGAFRCVHGDIRSIEIGSKFDAVVSLFHVVSYQTTNDDLISTFANASKHLDDGGLFLFDVWHGPAVLSQEPEVRIKHAEDEKIDITRIAEPELDSANSVVTIRYTIFISPKTETGFAKIIENHHMRYLFPTEIGLLADRTGFSVEHTEEFFTGGPTSENTWSAMYFLRKQGRTRANT